MAESETQSESFQESGTQSQKQPEGAQEYNPRRKPRVQSELKQAPEERKITYNTVSTVRAKPRILPNPRSILTTVVLEMIRATEI